MNHIPENTIVVRYPPSPTGFIHVGNFRTLILNYLLAKNNNGKGILRIEDTDRERSRDEFTDYIVEAFDWLGIDYQEFHKQSERGEIYKKYLEQLITQDKAYVSKEEPTPEQIAQAKEKGKELNTSVIRLRNPGKVVTFIDQVLGEISVDTTDLGDFIIAKHLDHPLYHFTVVVDDWQMGVTHVMRGNDHVANTPRHILIQEALGAERPEYVHLPLVNGVDGKKFSKRHGATATLDYRDQGYLPDAFLNFLAFVGWNPGTEQEVFMRQELIDAFSVKGIQKGSAIFNPEKLDWFNKQHLQKLSRIEQIEYVLPLLSKIPGFNAAQYDRMHESVFERISKSADIAQMIEEGELSFYFADPEYDVEKIHWKKSGALQAHQHLSHVYELLMTYNGEWSAEALKELIWPYTDEVGRGDVLWPTRYALSGRERSPDPFTLLSIFQKDEALRRIAGAMQLIAPSV